MCIKLLEVVIFFSFVLSRGTGQHCWLVCCLPAHLLVDPAAALCLFKSWRLLSSINSNNEVVVVAATLEHFSAASVVTAATGGRRRSSLASRGNYPCQYHPQNTGGGMAAGYGHLALQGLVMPCSTFVASCYDALGWKQHLVRCSKHCERLGGSHSSADGIHSAVHRQRRGASA